MDNIDRTFQLLKRPSFNELMNKLEVLTNSFISLGTTKSYQDEYENIIIKNNWSIQEFIDEWNKQYSR